MDSSNAQVLIDIFSNVDIYFVIFIRIIGFISIVPIIGGSTIPVMARLGFSMFLASIVYASGNITEIYYMDTIYGYFLLLLKEFFVGFTIGFVVYFLFNLTYLAGQLSDQQIGISMASVFDPVTQTQVPIVGNLYYFVLCTFFVVNGGCRLLINALFYSYKALPIGSAVIVGNNGLFYTILEIMIVYFKLGVLIALPVIGVILVIDVVLGVLVKTVQKLNVFVVGMPLKVFVGFFSLVIIVPMFVQVYINIYSEISKYILEIIKVMMP